MDTRVLRKDGWENMMSERGTEVHEQKQEGRGKSRSFRDFSKEIHLRKYEIFYNN